MSVRKVKVIEFAQYILNHEAKDEVIESISKEIFHRFQNSTIDERIVLSNIMDSLGLFFTELNKIVNESNEVDDVGEKLEDINREK